MEAMESQERVHFVADLVSASVSSSRLWQYGDRVRLLLRPVGVCIWIFLLC